MTFKNITERKKAEEELLLAKEKAEQAEEKSNLADFMAHIGEKLALGPVCPFRVFLCLLQRPFGFLMADYKDRKRQNHGRQETEQRIYRHAQLLDPHALLAKYFGRRFARTGEKPREFPERDAGAAVDQFQYDARAWGKIIDPGP